MPTWDFSSNPFTVASITPADATVTPNVGLPHQLNFDAGGSYDPGLGFFGEIRLPLTDAEVGVDARARLADWYGSLDVQRSVVTGVGFELVDDSPTNSYGDSSMGYEGFPPEWETVAFGSHGFGFALSGELPSPCPLATNLELRIHFEAGGPTFALQNLSLTLIGGSDADCGPTYPYGADEPLDFDVSISDTLSLSDTLRAELIDPTTPPPQGTGQPKRFSDGAFLDSCDPSDARATVCTRTTRAIPTALAAHLQGETLTLAYCLRLVRRDGEILGFTTHDQDLTFDFVTYEALNSVNITALRQELGATVGSMDLSGLIRSDRVTAADILAGRYDGAELTLFEVNWADLTMGSILLARGWWGAVTLVDGQWTAEYRSLTQRLAQQIVEQTSPTCRVAQLGDARCKVNLAAFQFARAVTAVVDGRNMTFGGDGHSSGYYAHGRVIFTGGLNLGLEREVKRSTLSGGAQVIELQEAFPFEIGVGDTATLEAGCDRRLATCKNKYGNVANFRGEPYVPGSEVLRRIQSLTVVG